MLTLKVLKPEEVDEVLRRDGHEAAVRVVGRTRMTTVLEHSRQALC